MNTRAEKALLWHLRRDWNSSRKPLDSIRAPEYETIICPLDKGHQRAGKRLDNPPIALPSRKLDDFEWTCLTECLIQDHVLALLRESGLTGFDAKPVEARLKKPHAEPPPKLWELVVTGWGGMAPPESGIRLIRSCEGCGSLRYSGVTDADQLIAASQWDGSDFFIVWPLPRFIFISDRAANVIRAARLKGAEIKPIVSITEGSEFVIPGYSPGRLSYYLPEARAHDLGDELGIY